MLLANKIKRFAAPGKEYRIRVDPIASRYSKADEAAKIILEHTLKRVPSVDGDDTIHSLLTVDSKKTPGIQLSDLLLGAVIASRQGKVTAEPKRRLIAHIAEHLGWDELTHDTYPGARKFNIWRFWDPNCGTERPEITRLATRVR